MTEFSYFAFNNHLRLNMAWNEKSERGLFPAFLFNIRSRFKRHLNLFVFI